MWTSRCVRARTRRGFCNGGDADWVCHALRDEFNKTERTDLNQSKPNGFPGRPLAVGFASAIPPGVCHAQKICLAPLSGGSVLLLSPLFRSLPGAGRGARRYRYRQKAAMAARLIGMTLPAAVWRQVTRIPASWPSRSWHWPSGRCFCPSSVGRQPAGSAAGWDWEEQPPCGGSKATSSWAPPCHFFGGKHLQMREGFWLALLGLVSGATLQLKLVKWERAAISPDGGKSCSQSERAGDGF